MLNEIKDLVLKAKQAFAQQRMRPGQDVIADKAAAVDAARTTNNRQAGDGAGVQEGDVIIFPMSTDELDERIIPQKFSDGQDDFSIGLLCPVLRKGRIVMQRVFPGLFNRANEELDPTTEKGAGTFIYPGGQPAEDFRAFYGSMYDTWASFIGKVVKVKDRKPVEVYGLKTGAVFNPTTRSFRDEDRTKRTVRIPNFEYVQVKDVEAKLGFSLTETSGTKEGKKEGEKK